MPIIQVEVQSGTDDANINQSLGGYSTSAAQLPLKANLTEPGSRDSCGLVFDLTAAGVAAIPLGSTVNSATVEASGAILAANVNADIHGDLSNAAGGPASYPASTPGTNNPEERARTTALVIWDQVLPTDQYTASPDITTVLAEVFAAASADLTSVGLILRGSDRQTTSNVFLHSFDAATVWTARINVDYSEPGGSILPQVQHHRRMMNQ